ncbi:hypothetical protein B9Z55_011164 [Caenorhabditis nigoni]|uniref:Uncharacterized protein n=1 Tax=Caenorhabditis nigoni TaxID=1611254 RepID=A0A2G5UIW8_9PELO|nr:hypothetical protein B9Z55_011164 [Caenorhabditis nigoni]
MDDFYITLPSSVKSDQFDNTSSRWVTRLPQVLYLEKEKYLVAATDVIYPYSFVNVSKELNYWVHFNDREPIHVTFPTAQYSNIDDVLNVLNGKPRATRKRKRDTQTILDNHMTVLKEGAKSAKNEAELKANFLKDSVTIGREAAAAAKEAKETGQAAITANVSIQKEAATTPAPPAPPVTPAPPPPPSSTPAPPTTPAPPPPPSSTPAPPTTPAPPPPPPSSTSAPLTPGEYLTVHKQVLDGQITPFVNVVEGRTQRMEDIAKLHGDIAKSQAEAVQLGKDYEAACQAVLDGSENAVKDLEKVRAKMNIKVVQHGNDYLHFDKKNDRIHIKFRSDDILFIEFEQSCAYFLGFHDTIVKEPRVAPHNLDLFGNVSTLYLYCDIVDPIIVGDQKNQLLTVIPCKGKYGEMIHHTIPYPRYLPIRSNTVDSIKVELLSEFAEPIHFHWGSSILVLHFKKIR